MQDDRSPTLFQSTLPRRERLLPIAIMPRPHMVSIHAPTQGATGARVSVKSSLYRFNPRSHAGSDGPSATLLPGVFSFNPRSHAGSDKKRTLSTPQKRSFNPRSHAGSDLNVQHCGLIIRVSIHAPTQGATICFALTVCRLPVSIHAPTQGATYSCFFRLHIPTGFNPRSHAGSDEEDGSVLDARQGFQSTLPRRERP